MRLCCDIMRLEPHVHSPTLECNATLVLQNLRSTSQTRMLMTLYPSSLISYGTSPTLTLISAFRGKVCLHSWREPAASYAMLQEWAMPDQLVSTTVTALLKIASSHPEHRGGAFRAIVALVTEIVERFKTADRE